MQITSFFVIKCLGLCAWVNEHPAYIIKKSAGSRLTPSGDMIPKLQIISIGNSGIQPLIKNMYRRCMQRLYG